MLGTLSSLFSSPAESNRLWPKLFLWPKRLILYAIPLRLSPSGKLSSPSDSRRESGGLTDVYQVRMRPHSLGRIFACRS